MRELFEEFVRNKLAFVGMIVSVVIIVLAVFAPLISPYDPIAVVAEDVLQPPTFSHPFGTDEFGRDVFSRVIFGFRVSLMVAFGAVGVALGLGIPLGLASGYYGRRADNVVMRGMDVIMAFPPILLAIAIIAALGPSTPNLIMIIGIVFTPIITRVCRAEVMGIKEMEYIEAARSWGGNHRRIIWRHILPNSSSPLIIQSSIQMAFAVLIEAGLSFIGLGTQPPTPALGLMLNKGRGFIETAPWMAIFPGLAIMLMVLSFNTFSDGLREALDPRARRR